MKTVPEPPSNLSKKHRIIWLQKYWCSKLWLQCVHCRKWRHVDAETPDKHPFEWTCELNSISCDEIEAGSPDGLKFNVGDLVVAHIYGYPWWPAVIDVDPVSETYFTVGENSVETYHVVFIDTKERAWVSKSDVKFYHAPLKTSSWKFRNELLKADQEAQRALRMKPFKRLLNYSYVTSLKDPDTCESAVILKEARNLTL